MAGPVHIAILNGFTIWDGLGLMTNAVREIPILLRMARDRRYWIIALVLSLLAHLLFWYARNRVDLSTVSATDPSPTLNVTLVATPSSSSNPAPQLPPPVKPPTLPPKPKPIQPKPQPSLKPLMKPKLVTETETKPTSDVAKDPPTAAPVAPPAASQSGPPATAAPPAGHYEGPRINADYLHNPRPEYPHSAKRAGQEGRVLLRVQILADGSAGSVSVARTSGFEALDEAAVEAVRKWKFVPAKRDGNPVESAVNVPINFNLKTE